MLNRVLRRKHEGDDQNGKRWRFRPHEKGEKRHEVPAHYRAGEYMDAYLNAGDIWQEKKGSLSWIAI